MLKHISYTLVVILALTSMTFIGCRNKMQTNDNTTNFEKYISARDTLAVQDLVNTFFVYAENGDYMEAAAMLYRANPESKAVPDALDNEEMRDVSDMLASIAPVGHRIEYIKFNETHHNEVRVSVIMREATADMPEVVTSFTFNPIDVIDVWYLCLVETPRGDRTIIRTEERDSMSALYEQQVAEQEAKKAAEIAVP